MFISAIKSSRDSNLYLFVAGVATVAFTFIMVVYVVYSHFSLNKKIAELHKSNQVYETLLINESQSTSDRGVDELWDDIRMINSTLVDSVYNPTLMLSVLEKHKTRSMSFAELSFDRSKGVVEAIITSKNYSEITIYLDKVAKEPSIETAQLRKKGRLQSGKISYEVFFVVKAGRAL